jgi:Ca-activated chloride channel family protein
MRLAEPGWLLLLAAVPMPWIFERARPRLDWPTLGGFRSRGFSNVVISRWLPVLFRMVALGLLAIALARPQTVGGITHVKGRGVTIVVALDQSSSMSAVDFPSGATWISRLEAAKRTLADFVSGRSDDPIGLVVFANYPDRASPPTLDHTFLLDTARGVRTARPGDDGTNLGDAIALALDDLRRAPTRRKVLILLTDGRNSPAVPRPLDPDAAAQLARDLGVTLHTIAVGQPEGVVRTMEPRTGLNVRAEVDAPDYVLLERLARITGGRAFAAASQDALAQVFSIIDAVEKSPVAGRALVRYREAYVPWVAAALVLLVCDRWLVAGRLRRLP